MRPVLYHSTGARGLRVLWTVEEIGLDCDLRLLPFPPRHQAPDYLAVNPLGTVPALVFGDVTMTESTAIAHFLAARSGPTPLIVEADEPDYGAFLDFLHHADATLTFPQTVYLRFAVLEPGRGLADAGKLYAEWFAARLVKLERRLEGAREFLCGGRFTIADIAIAYALFLAETIGLGDHMPAAVRDYGRRMMDRPAFKRAREREQASG